MSEVYVKGELLTEGKTKKIYEVKNNLRYVIVEHKSTITKFDDPSLTEEFKKKAEYSTKTTCLVFELLREAGLPIAYVTQISPTEFVAQRCLMYPFEAVVRRYAYGSYLKRHPEMPTTEPPYRFHKLKTEFFLKTTGGQLVDSSGKTILDNLDPKKGEEDPFIKNPYDLNWILLHPKKPIWDLEADLNKTLHASEVIPDGPQFIIEKMSEYINDIFLVLEGAWLNLGCRLIDMKVEFGHNGDDILIADVIDNDSWRLRQGPTWQELSKETFRQGEKLSEVERKYGIVTSLVKSFRVPRQGLILWTGSEKDEFPEVDVKFLDKNNIGVEKIVFSGHKSPGACIEKLEEIIAKYPDGGVIVTKVGLSNGLSPMLASRVEWPVIAISATADKFPDDIWSSLRMPSKVPLSVFIKEANALDYAKRILSQKNPLLYRYVRKEIEKLDF